MALPQPERSELHPAVGGTAPTVSLADAHAGASPDAVWLTACAWCGVVKVEGRWLEAQHARAVVDSLDTPKPNRTHGICPDCFDEVSSDADDERRARDES